MSATSRLLLLSLLIMAPACMEDAPELGDTSALATAKVVICHIPPGNPSNAHTIEVGSPAVPAHLAHGDYTGACVVCAPVNAACTVDTDCCAGNACGAEGTCQPIVCTPGEVKAGCYGGASEYAGVGTCSFGTEICDKTGTGWGACTGYVQPAPETCGDGLDNDCDGLTDEGVPEACGDNIDNDCDGLTDEGCIGDWVWMDEVPPGAPRSDGLQAPGETGIGGITFILHDAATGDAVGQPITSNADPALGAIGQYSFANVAAGDYYIEAVVPAEYNLAPQDSLDALGQPLDAIDSDFNWGGPNGDSIVTEPFSYDGGNRSDLDLGLSAAST